MGELEPPKLLLLYSQILEGVERGLEIEARLSCHLVGDEHVVDRRAVTYKARNRKVLKLRPLSKLFV
eukprot:SAG11_NODE_932_length_6489_cov_6.539039_6_plen_67_part_00